MLHRVVPRVVPDEHEHFWQEWCAMHPWSDGWQHVTWQDPQHPSRFETSHRWPLARTGAVLSDFIRYEVLWRYGGIYLDADVQPLRPLPDALLDSPAFVAWEDDNMIGTAVMACEPHHPAYRALLDECLTIPAEAFDAQFGPIGPPVVTRLFAGRADITTLASRTFYPYSWRDPQRRNEDFTGSGAYAVHHWAHSWRP